jgi:ADP-ribose pyrophosphatase
MKRTLHTGEFLALIREGHWEYAHRVKATGSAIIIAVTDDRKLLLVEQYRVPLHARTIELPAGIIGDEPDNGDEDHHEAARRELLEETGFEAAKVRPVMTGAAAGGLSSEVVTLFLASALKRVHKGGGVAGENITVHEVPLARADKWLGAKAKAGLLVDPKIYGALYFIEKSAKPSRNRTTRAR